MDLRSNNTVLEDPISYILAKLKVLIAAGLHEPLDHSRFSHWFTAEMLEFCFLDEVFFFAGFSEAEGISQWVEAAPGWEEGFTNTTSRKADLQKCKRRVQRKQKKKQRVGFNITCNIAFAQHGSF